MIDTGKKVFETEIQALEMVKDSLDEIFDMFVDAIVDTEGKVIVSGMGKSGHVARKISATFASLGISSFFLHPAEARHGDLGMIENKDCLLIFSNSGNTEEISALFGSLRLIGAKILGVTSGKDSFLAKNCDLCQILPKVEEACTQKLAPTSSTTVQLVFGDALAVAASEKMGVTKETFALYHPAGSLGKRLVLKVKDAMKSMKRIAAVSENSTFKDAIMEMCSKESRIVSVIDGNGKLLGIVTDGDIRRILQKQSDISKVVLSDVMTTEPTCLKEENMLVDAVVIMRERNFSGLPVVDDNGILKGCIEYVDVMQKGIG